MDEFIYRGKTIKFTTLTGVVLDRNKYSETHVSLTGGGGYIGPNGGQINAPTMTSSTITNLEFWIRGDDGTETDIKLRGVDIPIRSGQLVTVVTAAKQGDKTSWYSTLINHNAKKYWHIRNAHELNDVMKLEKFGFLSLVIAAILWLAVALSFDSSRAGNWVAGGFLVYRAFTYYTRHKKLINSLQGHIEKIASHALQKN